MSLTRRQLWTIIAAASVSGLLFGTRQSMSLFIGAINTSTGLGIAAISLAFACGQLMWGLTQPFAGAFADRYGTARTIAIGAVMVVTGTVLTPYARTTWMLILLIGVVAAGGAGMAGLGVLMSAVARTVSVEKRGIASAWVNAGASFGQFAVVPLAQFSLSAIGWIGAITTIGFLALFALPLAWVLRGKPNPAQAMANTGATSAGAAVRAAFRDASFIYLFIGFFVCGFHIAFIGTHLPGVVASCGLPPEVGAWSLALIGLFNIAGSFAAGWAIGRWRMKSVLAVLYASRAVAILIFLAMPKTTATFLLFAMVIGFTYLATVPPTIGLIAKLFGPRFMATLFGIVMLSHQVGGFLGAWLGGKLFEATGGYDWMWYADIMLAIGAALIHLPIRETRRPPVPVAA